MTLPITALTAAICAIMMFLTAFETGMKRAKAKAAFGDAGGDTELVAAMRSHGNLTENAPIVIIMIGLLELADAHHWTLTGIAVFFLFARACHIYGLHQPVQTEPSIRPHWTRALGVMGTWLVMLALIAWILFLVVTVNG